MKPSIDATDRGTFEVILEIPARPHEDFVTAAIIAYKTFLGPKFDYKKMFTSLDGHAVQQSKLPFIQFFATASQRKEKIGFSTLLHAYERFENPHRVFQGVKANLGRVDLDLYTSFPSDEIEFG